jgi:hypothetical protein
MSGPLSRRSSAVGTAFAAGAWAPPPCAVACSRAGECVGKCWPCRRVGNLRPTAKQASARGTRAPAPCDGKREDVERKRKGRGLGSGVRARWSCVDVSSIGFLGVEIEIERSKYFNSPYPQCPKLGHRDVIGPQKFVLLGWAGGAYRGCPVWCGPGVPLSGGAPTLPPRRVRRHRSEPPQAPTSLDGEASSSRAG